MNNSMTVELAAHVQDLIECGALHNDNFDEWHNIAFNEDYYIIGYYKAEQWLKEHDLSAFEAISTIVDYENENFGECTTKLDNAESVVNMYTYIMGLEVAYDAVEAAELALEDIE